MTMTNKKKQYFEKYKEFIISISREKMIISRKNENKEVMERLCKDSKFRIIIVSGNLELVVNSLTAQLFL